MITDAYIIVKLMGRGDVRDCGVFTGEMTLEPTPRVVCRHYPGGEQHEIPLIMPRPVISQNLDDAFLFPDALQASTWVQRLLPDWCDEQQRFINYLYRVRKYPDFRPGEHVLRNEYKRAGDLERPLRSGLEEVRVQLNEGAAQP